MSGASIPGAGAAAGQVATLAQVGLGQRVRMHLIAAVAVAFLSVYGRIVCPFVDGVEVLRLVGGLLAVGVAQILLRETLYRLFPRPWGQASLARHGMYVATVSWLLAGLVAMTLHLALYPDFPFGSHVKLAIGYWALGGGILSQLEFIMLERYLRRRGAAETTEAQSVELITRRLMESYGVFTVVPALILVLLAFREVYENQAALHDALEITFVGVVFVATALVVSWRYGVALREDCRAIRDAVRQVAAGEFEVSIDASRPDELGLVARGIGEMGRGLAVREQRETKLLQITSAFSEELRLERLLRVITTGATELLDSERSSLYLYDERRDQLWTPVAEGLAEGDVIYLDKTAGIAGAAFTEHRTISLDDVRADPRFDAGYDERTGFDTRTMLCVPVDSKEGRHLGVIQVLNRREGTFGPRDEQRLRALAAQAATAIENSQLFEDVLNLKNYGESILKSLSNGVISLDRDLRIAKVNAAGERVLGWTESAFVGRPLAEALGDDNAWVLDSAARVAAGARVDHVLDTDFVCSGGRTASVNLTTQPLIDTGDQLIGLLLVMEDLSAEKRVRTTMSRYMPKGVVEQVLEGHPDVLEGRMQPMTLLFTDIRSFTSISEAIGARATVTMLNAYFTGMVDVIHEHGGILDKYIGDAIMALFGVPFAGEDDERKAVDAANGMMRALGALNARRASEGLEPLMHGIGVSSGEAVAGNIGSPRRMDYTVIGDSVNLTARIESITKFYGTPVLVSDATVAKLASREHLREVDRIRVKGKSVPVTLYESYAWRAGELTDAVRRAYDIGATALEAFRAQDWDTAARRFEEAHALAPGDTIPTLYLERVAHYREQPPGDDWDGVWTMTSK